VFRLVPLLYSSVRWDRALGSETGRRTDHVPHYTLSQEAVTQRFLSFFPHHCAPLLFSLSFPLHLFLIPSAHHATPPAVVQNHPHIPSTTTLPSPPPPPLPARTPPNVPNRRHIRHPFAVLYHTPSLSFTIATFVSPCLRLAALSAPPIPTSPPLPRNAH
jgi:hypothetical protein